MEILIITGLSGAGKSQAGNILEDIGYFCIDNMPPSLIPIFAEMTLRLGQFQKVAIVTDLRAKELFTGFFRCLDELRQMEVAYKILFLDAGDDVIARRYRETRRSHPLSASSDSPIIDAIKEERSALADVMGVADYHIDTTSFTPGQLREMLHDLLLTNSKDSIRVSCISFGFKHGIPAESDIIMDVRFLPNPFYDSDLKNLTGLDKQVYDYVFSCPEADEFFEKLTDMLGFLLPLYKKEGKSRLIISIGCTGGKHRSVAVTERISNRIRDMGFSVNEIHRDILKMV